ncbi:MAG TPA: hypothetical protein VJH91_00595 [Candidatus Paceibacterota bacterium]
MDSDNNRLEETYRLVKENNRMLRSMRRNAFWGGIIKFILYIVIFVALPLWLYMTYLAPIVESMTKTMEQIQGTGAQAQAQFSSFQEILKQFQDRFSTQ